MDLTKGFPRSVKEKLAGVVMLARTADKARAHKKGLLGEYVYNCGMDKVVFQHFGIDESEFADKADALSDVDLERWLHERFVSQRTPSEIEEFNTSFMQRKPQPGSEGEKYFRELRDSIDPTRTDVTTWPQLLDLDEKREVPRGRAA